MEMTPSQMVIALDDFSGVSEARRHATALAGRLTFDATTAGELAIAVTEAAGNVVKHAQHGALLLRALDGQSAAGIEVLALDRGAGFANLAASMRDGHSTAGTPGTGLGALGRLASSLDIWSQPGKGALLRFEVWPRGAGDKAHRHRAGAISVPKPGESACGDAWSVLAHGSRLLVFIVDGLGHGPAAASAAHVAVAAVHKHAQREPAHIMEAVHDALRPTRGAAAAVALLQPEKETCVFCGVGNISACIRLDGRQRNLVSHNGILGHRVTKFQEFQYPFPRRALFIGHSDGIGTHWDLSSYAGLEERHPALVAAALYRDFFRGRDDATVVALRPAQALA